MSGQPKAFPESSSHMDERNEGWVGNGMTLRDYLAAKALPEMLRHFLNADAVDLLRQRGKVLTGPGTPLANAATAAHAAADAMLAEREKKRG